VEVTVREQGERRPLPTTTDLAAFRIVQEALTNVARHAPGSPATVRLTWAEAALELEVADDGPRHDHHDHHDQIARLRPTWSAPASPEAEGPRADGGDLAGLGSGNGLAGMRERAEAVGGTLVAGPRPGAGWHVQARLPAPAPDPPPPVLTTPRPDDPEDPPP
jgi:signal transduction histidine kinase